MVLITPLVHAKYQESIGPNEKQKLLKNFGIA